MLAFTTYFLVDTAKQDSELREELFINQVDFAVFNTDKFLTNCSEFSSLINSSSYLKSLQSGEYKSNVYSYKLVYDLMLTFKNNYSSKVDVSIYIDNSNKVLSTTNAIDSLFEYKDYNLIVEFLESNEFSAFKQSGDQLVYMCLTPNFYYDDSIVFIFYTDIDNISLTSIDETFFVTPNNEILFENEYSFIENINFSNDNYSYEIYDHTVSYAQTESGIIIANIFDTTNVREERVTFIIISISILLLCLIVALAFAYVLTFLHSKPLIKLSATMKDLSEEIKISSDKPIFDSISETIVLLEEENKAYSNTINTNKEIVKDQAIRMLIYNHRIPTEYDLQTYLQEKHFDFTGHCVILVLLAINKDFPDNKFSKLNEVNLLINQLAEEIFIEKELFIGSAILENRFISILLNGDKLEEENILDTVLQETMDILKTQIDIPINSAFSYELEKIEELNESFTLMKKQLDKSKHNSKTFSIKQDEKSASCFPSSIHTSLINAARSNEITLVKEILDRMYQMELDSDDAEKEKYCFAILCNVFANLYDTWSEFVISADEFEDIFKKSNSLEQRYEKINQVFERIIGSTSDEENTSENDDYIIAAKQYMHNNIKEDFSISLIADELKISTSYFNRIFKQRTGITPLQYMTNLRLKRAKDLLANTQMNIKDIAFEVGYKELRTFVRYFKKAEGVTPTEFKSLNN